MKNLKIMMAGMLFFFASSTIQAQVSVNVNLGTPAVQVQEVRTSANYYYIPDVQSYYDVRANQFIYLNNGAWIRSGYLPRQYRDYNLNNGYKVYLSDYHGSRPYDNYKTHKVKYYKGYKGNSHHSNENHGNDNHGKSKGHGGHGHHEKGGKGH